MAGRVKYNEKQKVFSLTMLAYLGTDLDGTAEQNQNTVGERLNATFEDKKIQGLIGKWETVWGPCVFQPRDEGTIANLMYVAKSSQPGKPQYVVSIAGTYPTSLYAWGEDFAVGKQVAWNTANPPVTTNAMIAKGTNQGFKNLKNMKYVGSSGVAQSLDKFLKNEIKTKGAKVIITGHSLGGTITPTVASWLKNTQSSWDPNGLSMLSFYTFAGVTSGNTDFANYVTKSQFEGMVNRVWNSKDLAPVIFNEEAMKSIPTLYEPNIPQTLGIDAFYGLLKALANGNDYLQVQDDAKPLNGKFNKRASIGLVPLVRYAKQVQYQHIEGYFALLNTMEMWNLVIKNYLGSNASNNAKNEQEIEKLREKLRNFI